MKIFKRHHIIEDLLFKVYKFYHNSSLSMTELKKACISLGINKLVPYRVGGAHWLSHLNTALGNFFEIYDALNTAIGQLFFEIKNCLSCSITWSP